MKTYKVQKTVQTEKITESYDESFFDNLKEAKSFYNAILKEQITYAGEYRTDNVSEYYSETIELLEYDDENQDIEEIESKIVYHEGLKDENNYRGDYANWYWFIAKFDGKELIYNFYDNSEDMRLEYENIKESELHNWYNYKR